MKAWMRMATVPASFALLFALSACEGDTGPQGPQGPAGVDGTDACLSACHTDDFSMSDYIVTVQTEFDVSQHNTGDTYLRRGSTNSPECSGCHTTEGYQYRIMNDGDTIALAASSRIGCFACHAPHSNRNFNLRKEGVTALFRGGDYDRGTSNTCAMCHQARIPSPDITSTDPIESRFWGPHHGPQANFVSAQGAYVLPGANYGTAAAHNAIGNGCAGCHMAALPQDGLAGGHTYSIRYDLRGTSTVNGSGCGCHSSEPNLTTFVNNAQAAFEASLSSLGDKMVTLGWLEADKEHVDTTGAPTDADQRGALYNYLMLHDDRSLSAHHPIYMNDVLSATHGFVDGILTP